MSQQCNGPPRLEHVAGDYVSRTVIGTILGPPIQALGTNPARCLLVLTAATTGVNMMWAPGLGGIPTGWFLVNSANPVWIFTSRDHPGLISEPWWITGQVGQAWAAYEVTYRPGG